METDPAKMAAMQEAAKQEAKARANKEAVDLFLRNEEARATDQPEEVDPTFVVSEAEEARSNKIQADAEKMATAKIAEIIRETGKPVTPDMESQILQKELEEAKKAEDIFDQEMAKFEGIQEGNVVDLDKKRKEQGVGDSDVASDQQSPARSAGGSQ